MGVVLGYGNWSVSSGFCVREADGQPGTFVGFRHLKEPAEVGTPTANDEAAFDSPEFKIVFAQKKCLDMLIDRLTKTRAVAMEEGFYEPDEPGEAALPSE